jgi:hypothetical protein
MLLFSPDTFSSRFLSKNLKIKIYETLILPIVQYGCETRSVTLRVFENGILRRIFGLKRDDNGVWRRLHNEEIHRLYRSPNIVWVIVSRRLRWAGHVAWMEEGRSAFEILTANPTWKRPLGRPRCRWEDNIRMNLE